MKRPYKRIALSASVVIVSLFLLQKLLVPKYAGGVVEGAFIKEYYKEEKDFDVIFIGDCEVYENFSPVTLWEDYGINSYIRGSAEQYIWQSYYILEDTLRYEKPKAVIFNVQAMQFEKSRSEAYNRMTLEGMKWSSSKIKSIFASMKPEEHFLDYVFPILRYHSRWSELSAEDVTYMFRSKPVSHNGYYMRVDVKPAKNVPEGKILKNYDFSANAWKYLDKIRRICGENEIRLILIKAPSLYPVWYDEWESQIEEYARKYRLDYINFLNLADEIGIDYDTDTYDAGLHMNLSGAEKLSGYLGNYLSECAGLKSRKDEARLCGIWEEKIKAYEAERQRQRRSYGIKE